jgi:predicted homoserine dehydrogenase-like protein
MPARDSLASGGLPIGLAHGVRLTRGVAKGTTVTWRDITLPESEAARVRIEMEALFAAEFGIPEPGARVDTRRGMSGE